MNKNWHIFLFIINFIMLLDVEAAASSMGTLTFVPSATAGAIAIAPAAAANTNLFAATSADNATLDFNASIPSISADNGVSADLVITAPTNTTSGDASAAANFGDASFAAILNTSDAISDTAFSSISDTAIPSIPSIPADNDFSADLDGFSADLDAVLDADLNLNELCGNSAISCPVGYSRVANNTQCSGLCQQSECCILNIVRHDIYAIPSAAIHNIDVQDIFSGEYAGKQSVNPRPVVLSSDTFSLPFTVIGSLDTLTINKQNVSINAIQRGGTSTAILSDDMLTLYDEQDQHYFLSNIFDDSTDTKLICKEEPWVVNIREEVDQEAPKRCMLVVARPLPCWIRRITVRIWNRVYSFPVLGWSRRCCGRRTGSLSWYSNATGCYQGTGPFLSEAQCTSICQPFERPDDPCVFGNLTLAHGASTECHGGTTCTCNDGALDCNNCRYRREIHDLHQNSPDEELRLVRALQWVSAGCDGACSGWLVDILQDHSAYGGHAHGNSKFFPWHRWYLKELEVKLQLYHPCVTLPWWDWTLDQNKANGNFGWVNADNATLWGDLNSNSNADMGEFTASDWTIPASYGQLARSSSLASIPSMATTTTIANYLARSTYGSPDYFKGFEGPHGTPHVMIGGQMGNMRSPSDPIFWIHHAAVDKLWYDWQDLHAPGTNYDANPAAQLSPQWPGVTTNDVFDSRGSLGVCYDGVFGVPPNGRRRLSSRRRLPTAIEYGLIAAATSPVLSTSQMSTLRSLEQEVTAIQNAVTFSSNSTGQNGDTCGKSSETCTWKLTANCDESADDCCMDSFAEGMNMDTEFFRRNQCVENKFQQKFDNEPDFKNLVNAARAIRPDVCANVQCTAHSTCKEGKCHCDTGYKLEDRHCVPLSGSQKCPAGCNAWYDGCNTCTCDGPGLLGACTKRFCDIYEEEKCVDEVCPLGCETWYDGCNTCTCDGPGQLGACTKRFCIQKGNAYCSKYKNRQPTHVKDTLPPVITVAPESLELSDDALKDIKPELFFSEGKQSTQKLNLMLSSSHSNEAIAFNPRVIGFNNENDNRGYLSLDFLDENALVKIKAMALKVTEIVIDDDLKKTFNNNNVIFEDNWPTGTDQDFNDVAFNVKDSGNSDSTIRVGGNGIKFDKLPSQEITVQFTNDIGSTTGRRLSDPSSRSLHRMLVPIRISDFTKFVFCRINIKVTFGSFSFTFTILRTGKQCCDYSTGSGNYKYNAGSNTCVTVTSGPFHSPTTCANLCVKDACPLPGPRGISKNHGSKFFSCTCNDGHWDEPTGCKHRKEVRDLTDEERTQLIDAMHWVHEGCDGDCGEFETLHPPSGGTLDWDMVEFFTDHVRYSGDAHGQWKFFPWHRKYVKEFETKLQLFDPCVTIPWWDWTQDQDKSDGNFGWIDAAGTDWGAVSNDNTIVGSGTSDGMKVGRFRCNQGSDSGHVNTPVIGNDWSTGSSTLGNCLWRNSVLSYISDLPDDGMIADYLNSDTYDGLNPLMDFEGWPHGAPHVMLGGQGSTSSRGQMGNGRSPTDPVFWLHHAAVDKLWWDWQNLDPSHFNDLGGATRAAQQLSTQWPSVTAGDMLDSEGDLKVCYSEPKPSIIGITWVDFPILKKFAARLSSRRRLLNSRTTRRRLPHYTDWTTSSFKEKLESAKVTIPDGMNNCLNPASEAAVLQIKDVSSVSDLGRTTLSLDDMCLDSWFVMMGQDPQRVHDVMNTRPGGAIGLNTLQRQAALNEENCHMDTCTPTELKNFFNQQHQCDVSCVCPMNYDPVCCQRQTYGNLCLAGCDNQNTNNCELGTC